MIALSPYELNPKIIFSSYYVGLSKSEDSKLDKRNIYDYEIELVTDVSDGFMNIDEKRLDIQRGDIIFRRPGQTTQGFNRYNSYVICFEAIPSHRLFVNGYYLEDEKSFQTRCSHELLDNLSLSYHTYHMEKYILAFKTILNNYISPGPLSHIQSKGLLLEVLYNLNIEKNQVIYHDHNKSSLIKNILHYIDNHLEKDLSLEVISERAKLSPIYFHQLFKTITGNTLAKHIQTKRINLAKDLLINSESTIKEICYESGFSDPSYFGYVFKKDAQMSPKVFRETYRIQ